MADTVEEIVFLENVSPVFGGTRYTILAPQLPPEDRLRRRLSFRNQLHLYTRKSAFSGANIISMFSPDAPFPVIGSDEWFSDEWSALDYGKEPDFSKPFFEQLAELRAVVPHMARSALYNDNCDFATNLAHCKNSYFIFNSTHAADCMYGENLWRSSDCIDCSHMADSELCYDCVMCERCYNLQCSWDCENCADSFYLLGCRGCRNCLGCVNLRHKEYCLFNEQVTKAEYETYIAGIDFTSRRRRDDLRRKAEALWKEHPRPHISIAHCEDSTGNFLFHSKNIVDGFFIRDAESLVHSSFLYGGARNCRDFTFVGLNSELMYECAWCALNCYLCRFCWWCLQSEDLLYCYHCVGCRHCFGCVGLRNAEYCVFNRQYSRSEYEAIASRLIQHMIETKEWGDFFPMPFSPIPYNHSMAQRFYPLTEAAALEDGLSWYDRPLVPSDNAIEEAELCEGLPGTDETFVIRGRSGAPFRVTSEELRAYRTRRLPLPVDAYYDRLDSKALKLGGLKLHPRICAATNRSLQSIYPSESGWIVWDKDVYEREFGS